MNTLERARADELSQYMEILNSAREFQREQGFVQWPDGYPYQNIIEQDIKDGNGYALKVDGVVAAYMYIGFDGDPSYPEIVGAWHYDTPYAVIHRIGIGSAFRGKGLADVAFALAEEFCRDKGFKTLRIDTDAQNKRMQHVLEKNGFSYCGTVIQGNGERMAFDKPIGD